MQPIFGVYHICTINRWQSIVDSQVKLIADSGLYDKTMKIFVTITGPECMNVVLPAKYEIVHQAEDKSKFERLALNYMLAFCKDLSQPTKIWYIHSKGARFNMTTDSLTYNNVSAWRQYMEYFVIGQHDKCIEALDTHDTCGINLRDWPSIHYSGNFWWAKSEYIKTLKPLSVHDPNVPADRWYMDWYLSPELWIGSNTDPCVTHHSLHDSGPWNFYEQAYLPSRYVT
jgi:hypothetical protein